MNLILLREGETTESGTVLLCDYRAKHMVKVLKSKAGDIVRIGQVNGCMGRGKVLTIQSKYPFSVEIELSLDCEAPQKSPVDLILALPRPIMLKRILSQAASLGFGDIHIVHAARVEKSFWESGIIEEAEYREHLLHGLEQAVDTVLPNVVFHRRFKPFIEDYLPNIIGSYAYKVLAHPGSDKQLKELVAGGEGKTLLAIGPEGGWVKYEDKKFHDAGFRSFSLGERILKVDTAVVNIHGRIMATFEGT